MSSVVVVCLALLLDYLIGEPKKYHPLVGFGLLANKLELQLNSQSETRKSYYLGAAAWCLAVLPCTILVLFLGRYFIVDVVIVYLAIGHKSLLQHVGAVLIALRQNDLTLAKHRLAYIVSRDVTNLDNTGVAKAAIESTLENGSDSTFAPILWYCIAGAPAVVMYRLANTLDAMWAYRTPRFLYFGYVSAKMDDVLNYIPARLCALSYAIAGDFKHSIACWRSQGYQCDSPNAGPVMASGAGALRVRLGGAYEHSGQKINKPELGCGREPRINDIARAISLITRTTIIWCVVLWLIVIV